MKIVYQANFVDCSTPEEAIALVERVGSGDVVKFVCNPNQPGCLPAIVHTSCAMWSLHDGIWYSHYIHDGYGGKLTIEKPH